MTAAAYRRRNVTYGGKLLLTYGTAAASTTAYNLKTYRLIGNDCCGALYLFVAYVTAAAVALLYCVLLIPANNGSLWRIQPGSWRYLYTTLYYTIRGACNGVQTHQKTAGNLRRDGTHGAIS